MKMVRSARAALLHNSTTGVMPCVDAWAESDSDGNGDRCADGESDHDATHVSDADAERRKHYNEGYLEGLEEGKSETIQEGFNEGFLAGGRVGFEYGQLKGAARSLSIFAGQVSGSGTWSETIQKSEEYLTKTTSVRALKAAHLESLDEGTRDFSDALKSARADVQTTGIRLYEYPEGSSSTA